MFKKAAFALALTTLPLAASAELVVGAGYTNLSGDDSEFDASWNALVASVGYKASVSESFTIVPELRVGFGIGDDSHTVDNGFGSAVEVKTEVDNLYGLAARGEFALGNGAYLFAVPSLTKTKIAISAAGVGGTDVTSDWEFGIGAGAGFRFSDFVGIDLSYEVIDEIDVLTVQGRFTF